MHQAGRQFRRAQVVRHAGRAARPELSSVLSKDEAGQSPRVSRNQRSLRRSRKGLPGPIVTRRQRRFLETQMRGPSRPEDRPHGRAADIG